MPIIKTIGLCLTSIILEAMSVSKEDKQWFEQLHQPKYAPSLLGWTVAGIFYYIICIIVGYNQFQSQAGYFSSETILLVKIMVVNVIMNFILFKLRSIKTFYALLYPFIILISVFAIILFKINKVSSALVIMYLFWLCFDLYYFHRLWQLNSIKQQDNRNMGAL